MRLTIVGDKLQVDGVVRLLSESLADRVQALHLRLGDERIVLWPTVDELASNDRHRVAPFTGRVPISTGATQLHIECVAGSRDRYIRSYTFALPASATSGVTKSD